MLDPLSQRQNSSAYNAEGDETVPGRSLIIMENGIGLRTLPWGEPFSEVLSLKDTTLFETEMCDLREMLEQN